MSDPFTSKRFDLKSVADALPAHADTLLVDTYLTDRDAASARSGLCKFVL